MLKRKNQVDVKDFQQCFSETLAYRKIHGRLLMEVHWVCKRLSLEKEVSGYFDWQCCRSTKSHFKKYFGPFWAENWINFLPSFILGYYRQTTFVNYFCRNVPFKLTTEKITYDNSSRETTTVENKFRYSSLCNFYLRPGRLDQSCSHCCLNSLKRSLNG